MRAMQGTAAVALALLVLTATPAAAAVEEDVLDLGGYTVDPGGPLELGGACPDPAAGEPAAVAFGGEIGEGDLGEIETAEDGAFREELEVPDDLRPGEGTLTVRCADGTELVGELVVNDPDDAQDEADGASPTASPSASAAPTPPPTEQDDTVEVPARGPETGAGGTADDGGIPPAAWVALALGGGVAVLAAVRARRAGTR